MSAVSVKQIGNGLREIQKDLAWIERDAVPKAAARALNRSNQRIRTLAAREISGLFKISVKKAKRSFAIPKFRRATPSNLKASAGILIYVKKIDYQIAAGPAVIAPYGKKIRRWTGQYPAFEAKMKSGHKGIFTRDPRSEFSTGVDKNGRKRRKRLPINEIYVDVTYKTFKIALKVVDFVGKEWESRFTNELRFQLSKVK